MRQGDTYQTKPRQSYPGSELDTAYLETKTVTCKLYFFVSHFFSAVAAAIFQKADAKPSAMLRARFRFEPVIDRTEAMVCNPKTDRES